MAFEFAEKQLFFPAGGVKLHQLGGGMLHFVEQGGPQADHHGFFSSGVIDVGVDFTRAEGAKFAPGGGIHHVHQPGVVSELALEATGPGQFMIHSGNDLLPW